MKISKTTKITFTAIAIPVGMGVAFVVFYAIYCLLTMKGVMIHQ